MPKLNKKTKINLMPFLKELADFVLEVFRAIIGTIPYILALVAGSVKVGIVKGWKRAIGGEDDG